MTNALDSNGGDRILHRVPVPASDQAADDDWWLPNEVTAGYRVSVNHPRPANIADRIADLLEMLPTRRRLGMIAYLSVRYYDGWRPGPEEVADLVAVELGLLTVDDYSQRKTSRNNNHPVPDITPLIKDRHRRY